MAEVPGTHPAAGLATPPTRGAALARIAAVRPDDYARTRNHLDGAVTGLSPYLTHGLVTPAEVLAGWLARERLAVRHKLVFELGWRAYFRHVWAHAGDGILQSLHPGPRPEDHGDPVLPADIRGARTGVPAIDRAVRTLYATGTLHNHARLWLASYITHLRQVHWRAGADWLVGHLLDGDLGSNHLSWQWVAGTGSHRPYLFDAANVARFAPPPWHSDGTPIDQPREALERIAFGAAPALPAGPADALGIHEPALHPVPPAHLGLGPPDAQGVADLRGREVWLVHPWALRPPPPDLAGDARVIGIYPSDHHAAWPWSQARWEWVDAAMSAVAPRRWILPAEALVAALAGAARVRSVADPHLPASMGRGLIHWDPAPRLFPPVTTPCPSFSQWWTRATRGLQWAEELR